MSVLTTPTFGRHKALRIGLAARPWSAFAVLASVTAVLLALYGRGLWYFLDEWLFILDRHLTIADLVRPHNEHWSAVLVVIYRGLIDLFGTASYFPFHLVLIGTHVFAASGVLALLLNVSSPRVAIAFATVFLAFGAGSDNLLWAFQIGFVLATGLGTWALAVAPRRPGMAAVLLTIAVATQGVGLFYLAAVALRLHRSRTVVWLALPVAVYAAWFAIAGTVGANHGAVSGVAVFFLYGLLASAGSLIAGGPAVGLLFVCLAAVGWRAHALTIWSASAIAGLFVGFGLIALARGDLDLTFAAAPRYLYACAPFVMVSCLAGVPTMPTSGTFCT